MGATSFAKDSCPQLVAPSKNFCSKGSLEALGYDISGCEKVRVLTVKKDQKKFAKK